MEINNTNIALFASRKESRDAIKIKSVFKEKIFYPLESPTLYHASGIINDSEMLLSVDTSLIHLAGSMNKTSYLLLSNPPDWRWGCDKNNELNWYDSVHIIRQKFSGNWDDVIEKLKLILEEIDL